MDGISANKGSFKAKSVAFGKVPFAAQQRQFSWADENYSARIRRGLPRSPNAKSFPRMETTRD